MSSDYKVHAMVSEMLAHLNISNAPEKYVEYLLSHKPSAGSGGQGSAETRVSLFSCLS